MSIRSSMTLLNSGLSLMSSLKLSLLTTTASVSAARFRINLNTHRVNTSEPREQIFRQRA